MLITDPPYGMKYMSKRTDSCTRIAGDDTTKARDQVLELWCADEKRPALVFGTWRKPRPQCRTVIAWDKGPSPGLGDLTLPWGNSWEEIYVMGKGFVGKREPNVIHVNCYMSREKSRPDHPTPKPIALMEQLIEKCPPEWVILDPFVGSGATLVAARNLGRKVIGFEIEEDYCELTVQRLLTKEKLR